MKHLVFICTLLMSSFLLAQGSYKYIPFPDSNYVWVVARYGNQGQTSGGVQYIYNGKKTIGQHTYNILVDVGDSNLTINPPYYWYGIRNDTLEKKVYVIEATGAVEYVLYDFSLSIGDTVPAGYGGNIRYSGQVITNIDTVLIDNRKRLQFSVDSNKGLIAPFIEGIGSLSGPLEKTYFFEGGFKLICTKFLDNKKIEYLANGEECKFFHSTGVQNVKEQNHNVLIGPNPLQSGSVVRSAEMNEIFRKIKIYNITGSEVYNIENPSNPFKIGKLALLPGVYCISVFFEDGQNLIFKAIK